MLSSYLNQITSANATMLGLVVKYFCLVLTYEGVEGGIGGHPSHFVDGLKGEDVLVVVGAPQGAAGAAAGAQVTRREGCWSP